MLDEFPALGRLDFFETALAFMAGYGIRAFLIAQSLNQISKAYGENNAILDNCHVRVAFATNDERTAKRISDALGTATEQRAMRNYAGHRLAPWLAHVMVSRQETARALLTPGEVMQLAPTDELVLVAGLAPIRAKKLRYFEDANFQSRLGAPPALGDTGYADRPEARANDWSGVLSDAILEPALSDEDDGRIVENGGAQQAREPELSPAEAAPTAIERPANPLGIDDDVDPAIDKKLMDRVRPLAPVLIGHALDEAVSHKGEQLGLGL